MVILSKEAVQTPLEMVQRHALFPTESPDTPDVGDVALLKRAVPEMTVQIPEPTIGELAKREAVVAQMVWSVPAVAVVGFSSTVIITSSKEPVHVPMEMVQRNTLFPTESPDTPDVGEVALLKIAVPEMTDQIPVPIIGELAKSEAVVAQIVWSVPAVAVVGFSTTVITTSSKESVHVPLEIVQRKMLFPFESASTPDVCEVGLSRIAVPEMTVQIPEPTIGELAKSEAVVAQIVWSVPAVAVVGFSSTVIITSSEEIKTTPLKNWYASVTELPVIFVTDVLVIEGSVMVAVPLTIIQREVNPAGSFPETMVLVEQIF